LRGALNIAHTIVGGDEHVRYRRRLGSDRMSPTWIWMQVAIVVFVVIGMIVAITKLA
jgi:hypothetical protein